MVNKLIQIMVYMLFLLATLCGAARAGTLDSPGPAGSSSTLFTLNELYSFLAEPDIQSRQATTSHTLMPITSPKPSAHTTNEIYALLQRLPATGQTAPATTDYPSTGGTGGSDGTIQSGATLRFVDNGNGTLTDANTGLMWVKDPTAAGVGSAYSGWKAAVAAAENLSYAGYSDWRLPNVKELQSIMHFGKTAPIIDSLFTAQASNYWSSTTYAPDTSRVMIVNFNNGETYFGDKAKPAYGDITPSWYIRPVRGGLPPGSSFFPIKDDFPSGGFQQPWIGKFKTPQLIAFSPPASGGDGYVIVVMDSAGGVDTARLDITNASNYAVQAQVYCEYRPDVAADGFERSGIFLRDDGSAVFEHYTGGQPGNNYSMFFDSGTGRIWCAKVVGGTETDLLTTQYLTPNTAWHLFRIEANGAILRFLLDGNEILAITDTTFSSGIAGIGFHEYFTTNSNMHGARVDNFIAEALGDSGGEFKSSLEAPGPPSGPSNLFSLEEIWRFLNNVDNEPRLVTTAHVLNALLPAVPTMHTTSEIYALLQRFPASGDNTPQVTDYPATGNTGGSDGSLQAGATMRFKDNGNGTVTDQNTNLVWVKDPAAAGIGVPFPWKQAIAACENLNYGDSTLWRLPNIKELQSIIDYGHSSPAVAEEFNLPPGFYWANTSDTSNSNRARVFSLNTGSSYFAQKSNATFFICPVRSSK